MVQFCVFALFYAFFNCQWSPLLKIHISFGVQSVRKEQKIRLHDGGYRGVENWEMTVDK